VAEIANNKKGFIKIAQSKRHRRLLLQFHGDSSAQS
jgi:hypothetical protein